MSKADQRKALRGTRQWYWTKDTNADNRVESERPEDIAYICDVDYYMDMPTLLSKQVRPIIMYTVVPESAASSGESDTSFCFDGEGNLTTWVAGGGCYHHKLWNYASDSILAVRKFCGIPIHAVAYSVERKQVGPHRQLLLLAPMRIFGFHCAALACALLSGRQLTRFDPVVKTRTGEKFIRFKIQRRTGTYITTARPGQELCATVPAVEDQAIAAAARLDSNKLMLPTAASWLVEGKGDKKSAAVLTEYHRNSEPVPVPVVYPVERAVRSYQFRPEDYDPNARAKMEAFMSPLVNEAYVPVPNKHAEERCVEGRINQLKKKEPAPSAFRDQCIDEFAGLVVAGAILAPVCYSTVAEKQTTPAQKLSLRKACVNGPLTKRILKCFIKTEAYQGPKDPRNISTYNDVDKLRMAQFALSLSEHCKQFPWYGPGKNPLQIATRVAEICEGAQFVNVSDYHRMDGTISYCLRQVDRAVCMKAFANHKGELNELLKRNADNYGILPNGTTFEQGSSHGSGCSATSPFQTLRATFTSYLAFRKQGNDPQAAFARLGIHLGDDGLDANLKTTQHLWAAERVGLVLEAHVVHRGDSGVNFLARYYSPEVWGGSLDSMCDVARQLSKLHVTVRLPHTVTPFQKLVEKARSYVATDGNTPVIGPLCKRVLLHEPTSTGRALGVGTWWSKFEKSVQYPNENVGGWMDVEFSRLLPEFDRSRFDEWLDSARCPEELLSPPLCQQTKPAPQASVDFVVGEEIVTSSVPYSECGDKPEPASCARRRKRRPRKTQSSKGGRTPAPVEATIAPITTMGAPEHSEAMAAKEGAPSVRRRRRKSRRPRTVPSA
jgi:hypothetical protein